MALNKFQIEDLCLGLNEQRDLYSLRPGESPDALNVEPGGRGLTIRRRGGVHLGYQFNPAVPGEYQTIYEWPGTNKTLFSVDNDVWVLNATTLTHTLLVNTSSVGSQPWTFEVAKDASNVECVWMVNGRDTPRKWDGTTLTDWVNMPARVDFIRLWKNRMVAGGDSLYPERLWVTAIGDPELPATLDFVDIRSSYDDKDPLTWCELSGDNLLVFKRNSTWLMYDSNTLANQRLGYPGASSRNLSGNLDGMVYFMSKEGLWATDGNHTPSLVDMKADIILTQGGSVLGDGYRDHLVIDEVRQRLILLVVGNSTPPSVTLWYYYPPSTLNNPRKEGTWWKHQFTGDEIQPTAIIMHSGAYNTMGIGKDVIGICNTGTGVIVLPNADLYTGDDYGGVVLRPVSAHWKSGVISLESLEKLERIRRLNLRLNETVHVELTNELGHSFEADVTTLDPAGYVKLRPEVRGREFQIRFSNIDGDPFEIQEVEFMFRGGKEHR